MFFWLAFIEYKKWFGKESLVSWGIPGTILIILANTILMIFGINITTTLVTIFTSLIALHFIAPYMLALFYVFLLYFDDNTGLAPSLRSPFGTHWWFFFRHASCFNLERIRYIEEIKTFNETIDNFDSKEYVLITNHEITYIYFRNRDDAVLFKLTYSGT